MPLGQVECSYASNNDTAFGSSLSKTGVGRCWRRFANHEFSRLRCGGPNQLGALYPSTFAPVARPSKDRFESGGCKSCFAFGREWIVDPWGLAAGLDIKRKSVARKTTLLVACKQLLAGLKAYVHCQFKNRAPWKAATRMACAGKRYVTED